MENSSKLHQKPSKNPGSKGSKKFYSKKIEIAKLLMLLVLVVVGTTLFVGAVAGWFDGPKKATLDTNDYCDSCGDDFTDITGEEYEQMLETQKSFLLFVDQAACTTADKVEGFLASYASDQHLNIYRIQFSDAKSTTMHEKVKYYPSVVVVSKGQIIAYLRADSDEDAHAYNDESTLRAWLAQYITK